MSEGDEIAAKQALLDDLRAEVEKLLCADDVSEEEKVARMRKAQTIMEFGVSNGEQYE